MDISQLIVFAHGGLGELPDHDDLMFLLPTIPLILIGTIVVATLIRKRGLLGPDDRTVSLSATLAAVAATLSLGAAAIHFSVIEEHLTEYTPFGLLFILLGWFQAIWAQAYLLRPVRLTAIVGAVANSAVVGVWLASRTTGLPIGPTPWLAEPMGTLDLFATTFEVALIAILVPALVPARWSALTSERIAFERAFVLGTFSVLTVTLLAATALLGVL